MQQLSLHLALRRLSRRITRRAERSVVGSVVRVTVRSVGSRVLFIGMLPLQVLVPGAATGSSQPLTGSPVQHKVEVQDANMMARASLRCPTSGAQMDTLRHVTPNRVVPVIRCWTAVAVTQGFVDAGHAE